MNESDSFLPFAYPIADLVGIQSDAEENEAFEQVDEDIAVTQSQMNFICPITQRDNNYPNLFVDWEEKNPNCETPWFAQGKRSKQEAQHGRGVMSADSPLDMLGRRPTKQSKTKPFPDRMEAIVEEKGLVAVWPGLFYEERGKTVFEKEVAWLAS
ncbi:hypothetical protein lerEdw1_010722 [Lerista edwardsae]|nr:hypothetical protein lerEdw1_010722 [Lerista edwardsae]